MHLAFPGAAKHDNLFKKSTKRTSEEDVYRVLCSTQSSDPEEGPFGGLCDSFFAKQPGNKLQIIQVKKKSCLKLLHSSYYKNYIRPE